MGFGEPVSLWRTLSDTVVEVNLDAPCRATPGMYLHEVLFRNDGGWVTLERRGDDLFLAERRVVPWCHVSQKRNLYGTSGETLLRFVRGADRTPVPSQVKTVLLENPHLIPEHLRAHRLFFFELTVHAHFTGPAHFEFLRWALQDLAARSYAWVDGCQMIERLLDEDDRILLL